MLVLFLLDALGFSKAVESLPFLSNFKKQLKSIYKLKNTLYSNANISNYLNRIVKKLTPQQATNLNAKIHAYINKLDVQKAILSNISKQLPSSNEYKKSIDKYLNNQKNNVVNQALELESPLASSWLGYGVYVPLTKSPTGLVYGNLSLTVTTGKQKTYTYYNVNYITWKAMINAKGSYGTGAGKVFWEQYLHNYISHGNKRVQVAQKIIQRKVKINRTKYSSY